jgi:putative PIN family toxin of toxin-antitoxin system
MEPKVIIDTNVLVAALRSRNGASFKVLTLIGKGKFKFVISVPLVLEYEDVLKRVTDEIGLQVSDIDDILDYLCKIGEHREVFFLWRPYLKDSKDDMILELAVESRCDIIVTHNVKDFKGIEKFGLKVMKPYKFLQFLGELK